MIIGARQPYDVKPVPAGTIITCPNCQTHLAVVARTIQPSDIVSASHFDPIRPQLTVNGLPAISYCCKKLWHAGGMLHTSEGWKP